MINGIRRWLPWVVAGFVSLALLGTGWCLAAPFFQRPTESVIPLQVVATYPHDPKAFTQGLIVSGDHLLEGTGHYGESTLRETELATGRILRGVTLNEAYFGEGIAQHGNRIYQLTWKERTALIYDAETLAYVDSKRYSGEGWGLTSDGTHLILSDGSATLRFLNPETFDVVRRITVRGLRGNVDKLNELEFVRGEVLANVWYSDRIARIDPEDGRLIGWLDGSQLFPRRFRDREQVLNGIAWDAQKGVLYLTGKNWPKLYAVKLPEL